MESWRASAKSGKPGAARAPEAVVARAIQPRQQKQDLPGRWLGRIELYDSDVSILDNALHFAEVDVIRCESNNGEVTDNDIADEGSRDWGRSAGARIELDSIDAG